MIGLIGRLSARMSHLSTSARLAWLNGVLGVVLALSLAIAATRDGAIGDSVTEIWAVLTAAAICTAAANAALILAVLWHGTPNGVAGALAGSLVGMMPPLFLGFLLNQQGGDLARGGVFGWIVVFYLTALLVKTLLVAPTTNTVTPRAAKPIAGATIAGTSTTTEAGA